VSTPLEILVYGPDDAGKRSNVGVCYESTSPQRRTGPIALLLGNGFARAYEVRPSLFRVTCPALRLTLLGSSQTPQSVRWELMRRAAGVLFVADSQRDRQNVNHRFLEDLELGLAASGREMAAVPLVLQYNKRDLRGAVGVEEMRTGLNPWFPLVPDFEAMAGVVHGPGVLDSLEGLVLRLG